MFLCAMVVKISLQTYFLIMAPMRTRTRNVAENFNTSPNAQGYKLSGKKLVPFCQTVIEIWSKTIKMTLWPWGSRSSVKVTYWYHYHIHWPWKPMYSIWNCVSMCFGSKAIDQNVFSCNGGYVQGQRSRSQTKYSYHWNPWPWKHGHCLWNRLSICNS